MSNRLKGIMAYIAMLVPCVGALIGAPVAVILAGASMLALLSILNHERAITLMATSGLTSQAVLLLSSAMNATIFATAAYGLGLATKWLWGL